MSVDFAAQLYREKEKIREQIAEETLHWWRQIGALPITAEHYEAKDKLMQYLEDIGV